MLDPTDRVPRQLTRIRDLTGTSDLSNENRQYGVDITQDALYGCAMADELKSETERERALIDPVLKFLFDQDRDELLRLMLGTSVNVLKVLDPVLPSGEQRSDGVLLVEDDANEQFVLHVEFMTRVARNMGERIFGYVQRIFQKYRKPARRLGAARNQGPLGRAYENRRGRAAGAVRRAAPLSRRGIFHG